MLDKAESANPYRPLIHTVRGRILKENADLAGAQWRARVEASYAKALTLDPRFFATRIAYASLLLEAGRERDAYRVLEQGMAYWYAPGKPARVLRFYRARREALGRRSTSGRHRAPDGRVTARDGRPGPGAPARARPCSARKRFRDVTHAFKPPARSSIVGKSSPGPDLAQVSSRHPLQPGVSPWLLAASAV